jgi:SAM-dependent methyltransferase
MSESTDSTRPEFWNERYERGRTPWDLHRVPAALMAFIGRSSAGSVLIPGCGTGYEIEAFAQAGWEVTAIDFSPPAVEQARTRLGALGRHVILGDFFNYDFGSCCFDVVYERTFLCALPPNTWTDYTARIARLLRPSSLLADIFLYGEEDEPPPYPLVESSATALLGSLFTLARTDPVNDSLPLFVGRERWQEWRRI